MNTNTMTQQNTKLINQGSYGCIYYPALPFKLTHKSKTSTSTSRTTHQAHPDRKHVSKLQKQNFHSDFEDYIGKIIQTIPSYELFFVPILKTYRIDLATIKQEYITDCEAVSKYIKRDRFNPRAASSASSATAKPLTSDDYKVLNKKFIIQKMTYIDGVYLHKYLLKLVEEEEQRPGSYSMMNTDSAHSNVSDDENTSDASDASDASDTDDDPITRISKTLRKDERQVARIRHYFKLDELNISYKLMSILFDLYERIMDSVQILIKYNIVHYDLKENNILIEKTQQLPFIIDFGLSIDISRLLKHPWSDTHTTNYTIDSDVIYPTNSSKIYEHNYLWRQHFYVHAPDYYLWPLEIHIMTFLINEHDVLTEEDLHRVCYEYVSNNSALDYTSKEFKKKYFKLCVETFEKYINKPREHILNELIHYWDKWDMYAVNIMFLKIIYEMMFQHHAHDDTTTAHDHDHDNDATTHAHDDATAHDATTHDATTHDHDDATTSLNEQRQELLDPHYSSKTDIQFKEKYKIKLKKKYNNIKMIDTLQVMLRNIHPNPEKRMTPHETKTFFTSIFYDC